MCDDLEARVEELVEEKVEQAVAERDARIDELEDELAEEREARQELEERVAEQEDALELRTPDKTDSPALEHVWIAGQPVGRLVEKTRRDVDELEDQLAGDELEAPDELEATAPPIFDLLRTPESKVEGTERRTRFLWRDLADYATKTPAGYVLPASDARRVLNAAEPDDSPAGRVDAKMVGRVFALSVDLTREAAFVRKSGRERQLVVPVDWEEQAREAAPDTAVS